RGRASADRRTGRLAYRVPALVPGRRSTALVAAPDRSATGQGFGAVDRGPLGFFRAMSVLDEVDGWSLWPAPAKLNLFLRITGRRDDGYHQLQTVFRLLDWGDSLKLRIREDGLV